MGKKNSLTIFFFKLQGGKINMENLFFIPATLKNGFVMLYDLHVHVENKNEKFFKQPTWSFLK